MAAREAAERSDEVDESINYFPASMFSALYFLEHCHQLRTLNHKELGD